MPKNVGRYQQGGMKTLPAFQKDGGGVPSRTPLGPSSPTNTPMKRENGGTVGNNDGHTAH